MVYRDVEATGVFMVIAKCSAKYHAPARYDDVLTLTTTRARFTAARIDHSYELKRKSDGALLVTAETTLACVDPDGRVQPIPEAIRNAVEGGA